MSGAAPSAPAVASHSGDEAVPVKEQSAIEISVIITTYNRCEALAETLVALDQQTVGSDRYEVLVVDNGCSDGTATLLSGLSTRCALRTFRVAENVGISAARNLAIREARGEFLVLVSDDLIVPEDFLELHLETLQRFPQAWVVGGLQQLPSLTDTPFGRYLDVLETGYDNARKETEIASGIWELRHPTARNLSIRRSDLERSGLFDEQFRNACEDVDLANRAREHGVHFLYNEKIRSLHNDQMGDLGRFCRAQIPRTHDTVRYYFKYQTYYEEHGDPGIALANSPIQHSDRPHVVLKKLAKAVLASSIVTAALEAAIYTGERLAVPDRFLYRCYRLLVGIYMFRGWRSGMALYRPESADREPGPEERRP